MLRKDRNSYNSIGIETTKKNMQKKTRKRWIDEVREDLKTLGVEKWFKTEIGDEV